MAPAVGVAAMWIEAARPEGMTLAVLPLMAAMCSGAGPGAASRNRRALRGEKSGTMRGLAPSRRERADGPSGCGSWRYTTLSSVSIPASGRVFARSEATCSPRR